MHTIDDLDVAGRRVLVRADFNVPLEDAGDGTRRITDDGRIRAALPTIESLRSRGARVILVAHLGRPKGEAKPELSLAPVAQRLAELLHVPVALAGDVTGPSAQAIVADMADGDVVLLENVRYDARETSKDPAERAALAAELASLADLFVSDGFGVVHREQASVTDVARLLPHAAGRLVLSEVEVFRKVLGDPDRPYAVVLGGSKVSDKLGVIENLLGSVDRLLVGGGMCFTFLAAQGKGVGSSLLEADQIETVKGLIATAEARGVELVLPVDVIVATAFSADAEHKDVTVDDIEDGWMGLDIGPNSRALFADRLADAKTVVWNGPMGVFEMAPYAEGTRAVAEAITRVDGLTVVGGGDSAAAVRLLGIDESGFSHISTGGGASLEFLEGRTLPGIAVLED
ncbi:MAG TPA: phosphoglycerate kinase [Candidatus Nanopelagicales bacterium]